MCRFGGGMIRRAPMARLEPCHFRNRDIARAFPATAPTCRFRLICRQWVFYDRKNDGRALTASSGFSSASWDIHPEEHKNIPHSHVLTGAGSYSFCAEGDPAIRGMVPRAGIELPTQ